MNDRLFRGLCGAGSLLLPLVLVLLVVRLGSESLPAWNAFGLSLLWSGDWNPVAERFGMAGAVAGTLLTSAIALLLAVPVALLTATGLMDMPALVRRPLSEALDLLAAIPSVIYGIWGLYVLAPIMQDWVIPFMRTRLGLQYVPFFGEGAGGFGIMTAGLVLGLMILPYIASVARDVLLLTPPLLREAAYGIGCTRWEATWGVFLPGAFRGIVGGVLIGLGRALGETMAVLFVVGNVVCVPESVFSGGTTIAALLANHFMESSGLLRSVLFAMALILFLLAVSVQLIAGSFLRSRQHA